MLLSLLLAVSVSAAKVDLSDDVKLATYFVSTPVDELPPAGIPDMMKLDVSKLPAKLAKKVEARKIEMHTLQHIVTTKKRGFVRTPEKDCEIPKEGRSGEPEALLKAGYEEVDEGELDVVKKKTNCDERELMCEFTLQLVPLRDKKGKVVGRRIFFYNTDVAFLFVKAARESKNVGGSTNFFGKPGGYCAD